MANKRKQPMQSTKLSSSKRFHDSNGPQSAYSAAQPSLDITSGQRGAFPGLDDSDDGLEDELSVEAIAYLRGVRSERNTIPHILAAPISLEQEDEDPNEGDEDEAEENWIPDTRGYYSDGAYVAYPIHGPFRPPTDYTEADADGCEDDGDILDTARLIDPQVAHQSSFLQRYESHRARLLASPPYTAFASLDAATHPTALDYTRPAKAEALRWVNILTKTEPRIAQLASMDSALILRLIGSAGAVMRQKVLLKDGKNFGAWVWGLFGRLKALETMGSEEVSIARELGKKAKKIVAGLRTSTEWMAGELVEETDLHDMGELQVFWEEVAGDVAADQADDASKNTSGKHQAAPRTIDPKPSHTRKHQMQHSHPRSRRNSSSSIDTVPDSPTLSAAREHLFSQYTSASGQTDEATSVDIDLQPSNLHSSDSPHNRPHEGGGLAQPQSINTPPQESQPAPHLVALFGTLNMILNIVGECYGQRDLLPARDELWEMHVALHRAADESESDEDGDYESERG